MARSSVAFDATLLTAAQASLLNMGIFTSDPTTVGTSGEVSGGTYARQTESWNAASGSNSTMSNSNSIVFNIPASTACAFVGRFNSTPNAATGAYQLGGALASTVTFGSGAPGTLTFAAAADVLTLT